MTDINLLKTRSVLDFDSVNAFGAVFSNEKAIEEDGGDRSGERWIWLPIETYDDLGRPDEVTVTIEPGNTLEEPNGAPPRPGIARRIARAVGAAAGVVVFILSAGVAAVIGLGLLVLLQKLLGTLAG